MSKKKKKPAFQGRESFSRMNFLYQASLLMAGKNDILAAYYGDLCKNIGKKSVLRMEPEIKRTFCKHCSLPQKPGVTANLSAGRFTRQGPRKGKGVGKNNNVDANIDMQVECRRCGRKRLFGINAGYNLWVENPESIVETINLKEAEKPYDRMEADNSQKNSAIDINKFAGKRKRGKKVSTGTLCGKILP